MNETDYAIARETVCGKKATVRGVVGARISGENLINRLVGNDLGVRGAKNARSESNLVSNLSVSA
jgi:hypothetical protein